MLSSEGEAMNRPQGDQAMRPMVPVCPRQMHRSLIPGTTSLPTSMKSPAGCSSCGVFFAMFALTNNVFGIPFTPKSLPQVVCQSSIDNPATRLNSEVLWVTRISPAEIVIAAIIRSFGPIGFP
jgi:hypothetical protein